MLQSNYLEPHRITLREADLRFSRLRLNGFKSFVDPTDLIITDGLTGVVGPNGCGKSNVLEALRWVMGENRASAMRGGGMEDVIFAGAATRPARNFAEVTISIDNSDRLAPAAFNGANGLEITRRITRDAGSAFKVNTKDVRARDVQMLFADASTGAHSPALVRQGQISELINARPKNRRRILEEAAGISGLYQRRHEAELKLRGAEANITRVDDVIEQLAAQLAQLARQARQAQRYRAIGTELRTAEGLLLYLRWKEADAARAEAQAALTEMTKLAAAAETAARHTTEARETAETALPAMREEDAISGAVVQRLKVASNTLLDREDRAKSSIETLTARIGQLSHDMEREAGLNRDAGQTVERLEWEKGELEKVADGQDDRLANAAAAAREAGEVLEANEATLAERTEDVARLAARHQSAERLRDDAQKTLTRAQNDAANAKGASTTAHQSLDKAADAHAVAKTAEEKATGAAGAAEENLALADANRADIAAREGETRAMRSEAEGEASALRAEVAALSKLLERDTAEGGQVMDLLAVRSGYEQALGAALADDLRAPVAEGADVSGWATLPGYGASQDMPDGVSALTNFVTIPDVLARRMSQVGLVDRTDGSRLQAALKPGQRLVSIEGDLWRWDGFRVGAEDAPSTAALRLQQINRLGEQKRDLEESNAKADGAARAHDVLRNDLTTATAADAQARDDRRRADALLNETSRAHTRSEGELNLAESRLEALTLALDRHQDEEKGARARLAEAESGMTALPDLSDGRAQVEEIKTAVEAARLTMLTRRSAHDEVRREGEARTRRAQQVTTEISGWKHRLETAEKRSAELGDRKELAQAELKEAQAQPAVIAQERDKLAVSLTEAEARAASATDALTVGERDLRQAVEGERSAERDASAARESRAGAAARAEAAGDAVTAASARTSEDLDLSPAQLLSNLGQDVDKMPSAFSLETEVARLRRQRDALGAVNLRAEEDAREVQEEHDTLASEKVDLESAIAKLRSGIAALNREGRERLLTAFEQVNTNFSTLFTHLFGGGEAKLMLVESDDPLEAGLEIMCQPPGKKLSTLSLLSGGEQTLTALALIFAVFLANPAPICVLDEVDAPLDDANVARFCDLLDEMTRRTETRFLIITHHAVTMSRMDRLYGVTMGEQGVSQLVSVDLKNAAAMVA